MENELYLKGKKRMRVIAVCGAVYAVMPMVLSGIELVIFKVTGVDISVTALTWAVVAFYGIFEIGVTAVWLALLFRGFSWARYLFLAGVLLRLHWILEGLLYETRMISPVTINFVITVAYAVPVAVLLFKNSAIKEFLNCQKEKRHEGEEQGTFDAHQRSQEKLYLMGKRLMWGIAVCSVLQGMLLFLPGVLSIIQFAGRHTFEDMSIILLCIGRILWETVKSLGVTVIWLALMFRGYAWARYVYIVGMIWNAGVSLRGLTNVEVLTGEYAVLLAVTILINVLIAVLLFRSRAIDEFMYRKRIG